MLKFKVLNRYTDAVQFVAKIAANECGGGIHFFITKEEAEAY